MKLSDIYNSIHVLILLWKIKIVFYLNCILLDSVAMLIDKICTDKFSDGHCTNI